MAGCSLQALVLADTHLGFDDPLRPRGRTRRRGPDFFANYQRALDLAFEHRVDFVVHGGDLLFRSRVPASLVDRAFAPLKALAQRGIPVVLVPGNHERSRIPFALLARHPAIHVLDRARTVRLACRGGTVAVSGFPYAPEVRARFRALVAETGWLEHEADVRLLAIHQAVEGARVGVQEFVFRDGADVVRGADIPGGFAAVVAGHVHRRQLLRSDLRGAALACPVLVPGSTERTSFAERGEPKGAVLASFEPTQAGGRLRCARFVPLPARPMIRLDLTVRARAADHVGLQVATELARLPRDSVVCVSLRDQSGRPVDHPALRVESLRASAPETMTVYAAFAASARGAPSTGTDALPGSSG